MEFQKNRSEKTTDQSSNQSATSEQNKFNQNQTKNFSDLTLKEEKNEKNHFVNIVRKYSMESQIFRKEFVPVLKPIEIHLVPSKFRLNEMEIKHNRKNKNIFSCFSCPCSEEGSEIDNDLNLSNSSDISDFSDLSKNINNNNNDENGLKGIRKKFTKIKSGSIQKVMTKKNLKKKLASKQFECFNIYDKENDNQEEEYNNIYNEKIEEDSFSSELYDDNNNFNNYSIKPYESNELNLKEMKSSKNVTNSAKHYDNIINKNNLQNNINKYNSDDIKENKRHRIYSVSILDTLKNKLKIDK